MFTVKNLLLSALLVGGLAQAQVGQTSAPVLQHPVFKEAKRGVSGIYTFADGASVALNERGGYLLSGTITLPLKATSVDAKAAARAGQLLGVLSGLGDDLATPATQFFGQANVQDALAKGMDIDATPFNIAAKRDGKLLKLTLALPQADPKQFAPTKNALLPKKATANPVVVRVYSDFQCPFCLKLENETMPGLLAKLPDDVQVEFHQFPLESIHPMARPAAEASECAAQQGKFWAYKDALFDDRTWLAGNPNTAFIALAKKNSLNLDTFKDCLATRGGKDAVDAGIREAIGLKINGTPSVFVGNFKAPNPYDVNGLLKLIQMARAANSNK